MYALKHDSPRRPIAATFGQLLDRRMRERKVGAKVLGPAAGVAISAIGEYRRGYNLPSLAVALRLADSLDEPQLLEIARLGRTKDCKGCGRPFVGEHNRQAYCSVACRAQGSSAVEGEQVERGVMLLRGELLRMGAPRKQAIGKALTMLDDALQPGRVATEALAVHQSAVAAMCGSCEPLGLCRTPACDLRGVSPLPLATSNPDVVTAVPPPGRWGQPGAREGFSDHLRERWQEPGRKEAQAERSRARWAALSEDERAELTQKMVGAQGRFRQQAPEIAGGGRHGET